MSRTDKYRDKMIHGFQELCRSGSRERGLTANCYRVIFGVDKDVWETPNHNGCTTL